MENINPNFVLNGKFYNKETSTLILESDCESNTTRYYKSAKGTYFRTIEKNGWSLTGKGIEKICDIYTFENLRNYLEQVQKGNAWSYTHKIAFLPEEFKIKEEA